jgi:hydroxyacyl-ACP dehydratase HTD2-like protein with hotdog domain
LTLSGLNFTEKVKPGWSPQFFQQEVLLLNLRPAVRRSHQESLNLLLCLRYQKKVWAEPGFVQLALSRLFQITNRHLHLHCPA